MYIRFHFNCLVKPLKTAFPAAFDIQGLIDRNPVKPGGQLCLMLEISDLFKYLDKNFLNDVQAFFPILGNTVGNTEKPVLKLADKRIVSLFLSLNQAENQSFFTPKVIF